MTVQDYIEKLCEIRKKEFLSLAFLAEQLRIASFTISRIITHKVKPSLQTSAKIKAFVDKYEKEGKTWH